MRWSKNVKTFRSLCIEKKNKTFHTNCCNIPTPSILCGCGFQKTLWHTVSSVYSWFAPSLCFYTCLLSLFHSVDLWAEGHKSSLFRCTDPAKTSPEGLPELHTPLWTSPLSLPRTTSCGPSAAFLTPTFVVWDIIQRIMALQKVITVDDFFFFYQTLPIIAEDMETYGVFPPQTAFLLCISLFRAWPRNDRLAITWKLLPIGLLPLTSHFNGLYKPLRQPGATFQNRNSARKPGWLVESGSKHGQLLVQFPLRLHPAD